MKTVHLTFLIFLSILFSCSSDDDKSAITAIVPACDVENPLEELSWLNAEIEKRDQSNNPEMKYCSIVQAEANGQTIFIYEDCNPLVDKAFLVFDCAGELLNTIVFPDIENRKTIWKPYDFVCASSS